MVADAGKSIVELYPFQRTWMGDHSRAKLWHASRRVGKTFITGLEVADDAVLNGALWRVLSASWSQTYETLRVTAKHITSLLGLARELAVITETHRDKDGHDWPKGRIGPLPSGGVIEGLPANGNTARGYEGNVWLDEFGRHDDDEEIWAATAPITLGKRYRMIITSTGNGTSNRFARILGDAKSPVSKHRTTINDARDDGMYTQEEVDYMRQLVGDDRIWRQEFLCELLDADEALFPWSLIKACESSEAAAPIDLYGDSADEGRAAWREALLAVSGMSDLFGGYDVGKARNLAALAGCQLADVMLIPRLIARQHRTRLELQQERVDEWCMLRGHRRTAIDSRGMGDQLSEHAQRRFGQWSVWRYQATAALNAQLAYALYRRCDDRTVLLPTDHEFQDSLHSIRKTTDAQGNVRVKVPVDGDLHADDAMSLIYCNWAASEAAGGPPGYEGGGGRRGELGHASDGRGRAPAAGGWV